ncbi:COP9 signalosome complex subunit 4 [Gracilariopsis chorda]|uniref:COP9 signalosome complex subunit 4 n=1 Tax=Gracilariopsis chorda TaxID=448386 RepID=A0A2V3IIJ2_9FLOR|nr:COP9 signalosome complex subunit 4 [Gracilariopsis chorda]|eukprot:PXF41925.1 COP9 signalosome complex subunit 4 [Gracilariopsis chorda]
MDTPEITPSTDVEALRTENVTMTHPDIQQQQEVYYKHLCSLADPPRASSYTPFLQKAIATHDIPRITALATFLYSPTLPLPTARSVYSALANAILNLPSEQFDQGVSALLTVHNSVARAFAYESALLPLRERLSAEYEARGLFVRAAVVLVSVPTETRQSLPESSLLRFNLRVARLFAAAGETTCAERFLSRAASQLPTCTDEPLMLQHRAIHARLLDAKGRFVDASIKYYSLSQVAESAQYLDVMADASPALVSAVTCAILAPAGPRRSRMLAVLYNDERSRTLDLFPLLESIHMGRLLRQEQLEKFRPTLQPHQVMRLADGDTVLDRAVMEHNMLATSRLYESIGFKELGELLGVSATKAETTAADMIYEDRMKATIDQVEGRLQFASTSSLIERWDAHIASLCTAVDDCVEAIVNNFPQFTNHLET